MAVGAYAAAYFTVTFGDRLRGAAGVPPGVRAAGRAAARWASRSRRSLAAHRGALRRHAVAAPAGRLPGDRDARVRRDHPRLHPQHRRRGRRTRVHGHPAPRELLLDLLVAAATILVVYRIVHSSFGRALVAIREDEIAAEAMGVHTTRYKVMAFVVVAGPGGHRRRALRATSSCTLNPQNLHLPEVDRGHRHDRPRRARVDHGRGARRRALHRSCRRACATFAQLPDAILFSLLLILLMIVRPQGLLGRREFVTFLTRRRRPIGGAAGHRPGSN